MGDLVCTKCGDPGLPEDFYADPHRRSGRQSWCRVCANAAARARMRRLRLRRGVRPRPAHPAPGPGEAWCPACRANHPASAFAPDRSRTSGHRAYCRVSDRAYNQARYRRRTAQRGTRPAQEAA